jgi:RNA ligase (TIGR02306 family)
MSTLEVKVVRLKIENHPNADRLQIGKVIGTEYIVVVGKGQFYDGDPAIFIPEDAVVPQNIQDYLATSQKITINGGRIRCSKIRGIFSDGLCLTPSQWLPSKLIFEGSDVKEHLGITKYEPPPQHQQGMARSKGINHNYTNENFKRYTDIDNFKKYSKVFQEGEIVVITKKYHGSNWRASIVKKPKSSLNFLDRLLGFLGIKKNTEYLVGSHNTIRKQAKKAPEIEDVYHEVANKYSVEKKLKELHNIIKKDIIIYGEVIGTGIQKGYEYGIEKGEHQLRIFDVMIDGKYLSWGELVGFCVSHHLPIVEVVYAGPWNMELTKFAEAVDEYNGKKYVREGVVIKPIMERRDPRVGRVILKYVSETFRLDKQNTSFH